VVWDDSLVVGSAYVHEISNNEVNLNFADVKIEKRQAPCTGDIIIKSQADVGNSMISNCTFITGDIYLTGATGNITFANSPLTTLNGSIYDLGSTDFESLDLGPLSSIGVYSNRFNDYNVAYTLAIVNAMGLRSLSAAALTDVLIFNVTNAPQLAQLYIPQVNSLPGFYIGSTALDTEAWANGTQLQQVGDLWIHDCANLTIGPDYPLFNITSTFSFMNNGDTSEVDLTNPSLEMTGLYVQGVERVEMDNLASVAEQLTINSTVLDVASFANLSSVGGTLELSANWPAESWSFPKLTHVNYSLIILSPPDVISANAGHFGALDAAYNLTIVGNFSNL
jgi:hypothetical protein